MNAQFEEIIDRLLEKEYHVIDILPDQVKDCRGQYFAADEFFRTPERLRPLRTRFSNIIVKLNCYYDISVCFYPEEVWEKNPAPADLTDRITAMPDNEMVRVMIEGEEAMIDIDGCDTYMTIYGAEGELLGRVEALAKAEGLFVR